MLGSGSVFRRNHGRDLRAASLIGCLAFGWPVGAAEVFVSGGEGGAESTRSSQQSMSRFELNRLVERLASIHGLDVHLVYSVIAAESGYDATAISAAGAIGLMQVMPATAAGYGVLSVDALFEPATNLDTGMRHLRRLLDRYRSIGDAVMAYNAGEGALERSGGFVGYAETQRYTHTVIVSYL